MQDRVGLCFKRISLYPLIGSQTHITLLKTIDQVDLNGTVFGTKSKSIQMVLHLDQTFVLKVFPLRNSATILLTLTEDLDYVSLLWLLVNSLVNL